MKPEMSLYYSIPLDKLRDTKSFSGGEEAVKAEGPVCPSGNLGGPVALPALLCLAE